MGVRFQSGMLKSCRAECGVTQKSESTRENDRKRKKTVKKGTLKMGKKTRFRQMRTTDNAISFETTIIC